MNHKGFTLIELMIVVAIIGILAAVAIPQYQNYVARAQVSEALVLMSGAKTGVAEYVMVTGDFPANNGDAGIADKDDITGSYVDKVEVSAGGVITATFKNELDGAHAKIASKTLTLTPLDAGGSITWTCSGADITTYLPSGCDTGPAIEGASSEGVVDPLAEAWRSGPLADAWRSGLGDDDYLDDQFVQGWERRMLEVAAEAEPLPAAEAAWANFRAVSDECFGDNKGNAIAMDNCYAQSSKEAQVLCSEFPDYEVADWRKEWFCD